MKKRFRLLFSLLALTILVLVSCANKPSNGTTNSSTDNGNNRGEIYSPQSSSLIIFDEGGVSEENLSLLKEHISNKTGGFVITKPSSTLKSNGEIILGKTSRELSKQAYTYLERIELKTDTEVRYVICSDGNSVAIAYDDAFYGTNAAENAAISHFIDQYCTGSTLRMTSGVYAKESFCAIERQKELDALALNDAWDNAYTELSELYGASFAEETLFELKKHYALYTEGAVDWIANLFDPVTGGFYYSNSARDTVGYLPDLESTGQALSLIGSTGMFDKFGGDIESGVPQWFCERIVAFVKGLQDSENGYFYHPQWMRAQSDANSARLGRDLTNAVNILKRFDAIPYYDTPTGVKGENRLGVIPSYVTPSLSLSSVSAVSKIITASSDDSAVAEHLRTEQSFRAYLASLNDDIIVNDYKVGNLLESQANQIAARDRVLEERKESYRLSDILEEWLTSKQNPQTGLWAKGNKNDYDAVNGLLKISSTYSKIGKQVPNAELGLKSAVRALTSETEIRHVCDILNPWYAIRILTDNIASYSSDTTALESIRAELIENYPSAVRATTEKLAILHRPDGSFGYLPDSSSPTSQEMPVAVPDTYEGDVNASYIAISSIPGHMFSAVGVGYVAPYSESDRLRLYHILEKMGAIIKDDVALSEPITFDDDNLDQESSSVTSTIRSSGSATVRSDPHKASNKVLLIDSYEDGAGLGSDDILFEISNKSFGNGCFMFECDLLISDESREGMFAQINMGPELFMLNVSKKDGEVYIAESSSSNSTYAVIYDVGRVAKVDEWFNLRIEYYPGDDSTVRIKLFIDDVLLAVSDNYYDHRAAKLSGEGIPGSKYLHTKFVMFSNCRGKIYVDNVRLDKTSDVYKPLLDSNVQPLLRNVDSPDIGPSVYDFEDESLDDFLSAIGVTVEESEIGKALVIPSSSASVMINANARGSGANAALFKSQIYVPESTSAGAKLAVNFCNFGDGSEVLMGIHLIVCEDGKGKYLSVAEGIGSSTGSILSDVRLPIGKAFTLRVEFFFKKSVTAVYADDSLIGTTLTSANGSNMKYFSKVRIFVPADGKFILDDIRAERVNINEFTEKDIVVHGFDKGFGDATASPTITIIGNAASFASAEEGDFIKVPVNKRSDVPSVYTSEYKFKMGDRFLSGGAFKIALLDENSEVIISYDIIGEDGKIFIYESTENGRYPTALASVELFETLTIKYSKKLGVAILYADERCIATSNLEYSFGSFGLNYSFAKISALDGNNDFSLVSCVAEISMQEFEEDTPENIWTEQKEYFEYEKGSSIDPPYFITHELSSNSAALSVKEVIRASERSKVFSFITGNGGKDVLSFARTTSAIDSSEVIVFESNIMVDTRVSSSSFEIEPVHGDTRAYKLTVSAVDGGNITISGADIPSTVIAKEGEWFKLRIEYTNLGKDVTGDGLKDIKLAVFVNGQSKPKAVGYKSYTSTTYNADEISAFRFFTWTAADIEFLFDNTFVGDIGSSSAGDSNASEDGDSNFDDDAWADRLK